jgi:hypothetical protein
MFETVKDLWHDYICLHQSKNTKQAIDNLRQATSKFEAGNLKMEGAVMHLILNGNGHDNVEKHVKPNSVAKDDDVQTL